MGERTILLDSTASTKNLNSDFLVEAVESGMGYVLVSSGRFLPILPVFCSMRTALRVSDLLKEFAHQLISS